MLSSGCRPSSPSRGQSEGWNLRTRRLLIGPSAIAAVVALSGCILFPPFFPPIDGEGELMVENATDTDWILDVGGTFPMSFAVGAGQVGTAPVFADSELELVLRSTDCEEVDRLDWNGGDAAVRIAGSGSLTASNAAPLDASQPLVEVFECAVGIFPAPEAGDPLPQGAGRIMVFSTDGAPFLFDVAARTFTQLTPDPEQAGSFALESYHVWSPDGTRLAFSAEEGAALPEGVYVADDDRSDPELIVDGGRIPHWSPDGTRIAYIDVDPFEREDRLEVIDLATGAITELATDATDASWSPDGSRLAYVTGSMTDLEPTEDSEVRVVNADGSGTRTIGLTLPYAAPPAWSRDGTRIAFATPAAAERFDIGSDSVVVLHDLASGETTVLESVDGQSFTEPAWSPDGQQVAVIIADILGADGGIGVVEVATGALTELHQTDESFYATPVWSPDGDWLAFTRTAFAGLSGSLIAVRPDGTDATTLATGVLVATEWRDIIE